MNSQERKLLNYFESHETLSESWGGNFEKFLHSIRNKYRTSYQKEFPDFGAFIDCLIGDEEEKAGGTAAGHTKQTKRIDSLQDEFERIFKAWIAQAKDEESFDEENENGKDWLFFLEAQAVTNFYNALSSYKELLENNYRRQLWKKDLSFAPRWMIEDPDIAILIAKYKICEILNELEKTNSRSTKTKRPFRYLFRLDDPKYLGKYAYACFITNQSFYDSILPELKIKKITMQKYLKALSDVGAIRKLDAAGRADVRKNETLYAAGYLSDFKGINNIFNRFLTQNDKKKLAKFKLP